MIYFARLESGLIKIGTTDDIRRRLMELACLYGQRLELLGAIPGDHTKEREIHVRFARHRIEQTEHFMAGDDLLEFISESTTRPECNGRHVRLRPNIVTMAKTLSVAKGMAMGDYLSDLLEAPISREYAKVMRELERKGGEA